MFPLAFPPSVYLCTRPVDFRKAFDGLCGEVRDYLKRDPLDGSLFVFYNKRRDRLKILLWDNDGFWLFYKRLEIGTFQLPRTETLHTAHAISAEQLHLILSGIDLRSIRHRKRYNRKKLLARP